MKALLIHYLRKNANANEKSQVQRLLYGYKDYSNRGSYIYQRKGILDELLHKKIDQRVILISEKDKKKVQSMMYDMF